MSIYFFSHNFVCHVTLSNFSECSTQAFPCWWKVADFVLF